jgi:hypothetical protein
MSRPLPSGRGAIDARRPARGGAATTVTVTVSTTSSTPMPSAIVGWRWPRDQAALGVGEVDVKWDPGAPPPVARKFPPPTGVSATAVTPVSQAAGRPAGEDLFLGVAARTRDEPACRHAASARAGAPRGRSWCA